MLLSILIPTRKRLAALARAINSIATSATGQDYEVILRMDDDDSGTMMAMRWLQQVPNRKLIIGPRLNGWRSIDSNFMPEMEDQAKGKWIMGGNDDMVVSGDWLGELRKVPLTGFIVQPEISWLGGSTYPYAEGQAFPIVPRFCWKQFSNDFPRPMDTAMHTLLTANGWKTRFLPGVTFHHQRPSDAEIELHRTT